MGTGSGILSKIRDKGVLLVFGVVLTFALGVILSSVFVTIDIGKPEERILGVAFKTSDPNEALVIVTVTNEAPFEFPAVKTYYQLNVEIDDASINAEVYYEEEVWGDRKFSDKILNLGHIPVTGRNCRNLPP